MKSVVEDAARVVRSLPYASIYPRQYVAHRVDVLPLSSSTTLSPLSTERGVESSSTSSSQTAVIIDGDITKPFWSSIPWSSDFVDIATSTTPQYTTRMKMKWDDTYLYVAAYLEEPHIWGTLIEHNSVIYQDNDFEIFVDTNGSNHNYKEFEVNALGTTWSLLLNKPYDDGGVEDSKRVNPITGYDMEPEIHSAVQIYPRSNESINNPSVQNTHWTVEVALPIAKLMLHNTNAKPPDEGVYWRVNFSRAQWGFDIINNKYVKRKCCQSCAIPGAEAEDNWVWSAQGQVAMHLPERWGILQFTTKAPPSSSASSASDDGVVRGEEYYIEWSCRCAAMAIYYAMKAYHAKMGAYTSNIDSLREYSTPPFVLLEGVHYNSSSDDDVGIVINLTSKGGYEASVIMDSYTATVTDERYLIVTTSTENPPDNLALQS